MAGKRKKYSASFKAKVAFEAIKGRLTAREIGHYRTGDLEWSTRNPDDFELAKQYIELAYQNVGG